MIKFAVEIHMGGTIFFANFRTMHEAVKYARRHRRYKIYEVFSNPETHIVVEKCGC